jgi:uncharacterized repeat protein (TIGR03843 family)
LARPDAEHRRTPDDRYFDSDGSAEPDDETATAAELTPARVMAEADAIEFLTHADLTIEGQLVDASNATLYVGAEHDGVRAAAVYKPVSGERPLWDFPDGTLAEREVAAHAVSAASGWGIVPPTVLRDGPFGPGMVQLWIDVDDSVDIRSMLRRSDERLRPVAVFDALINNADRKGGHLLPTPTGHVYGVDHGVCFNTDEKLRTVLWGWAGDPLSESEIDVVIRLRAELDGALGRRLSELLTVTEVRRTRRRADRLLSSALFPQPSDRWPPVPWPPF